MDGEGLFVPKMHAVLHMLASILLFGAVDNARLGDQEKDHQPYGVQHGIRHVREPVHAGQQGAPAVHAVQMWSPGLKNCLGTLKTVHQTVHQLF